MVIQAHAWGTIHFQYIDYYFLFTGVVNPHVTDIQYFNS
jgi:hypothetical protein